MKLIGLTILFFFHTALIPIDLEAADKSASVFLRALISNSVKTNIREFHVNSHQTLWLLSSQVNAQYPIEAQKFEVEGLDQVGLEIQISKVMGTNRTIQHKILIDHLKFSMKTSKNIFLKISAN
jgi:hypothetical protein